MTKRTLLVVLVAAALLIIGALVQGGRGDGATANWFQRIHGH